MFKKIVACSVMLSCFAVNSVVNADTYTEISCNTDPVFAQNSCQQCFDGWVKWKDSTVGGLSDLWVNDAGIARVMYEDIQEMPNMVALNGAEWSEDKVDDKFWKLTDEVKALFNKDHQWFLLDAWKSVNWIETTEWSSYLLAKNPAEKWANIWLLVYTITTNPILENWEVSTDTNVHKECVLFKSGDAPVVPTKGKPKELPKTWPEQFLLLLILAMFLAFGILRFKKS